MRLSWARCLDVALAVIGAAAFLTEGSLEAKSGLPPGAYLLGMAAAAPLAWRTRAPLVALLAAEVGAIACVFAFEAGWAATAVVVVMLFTVALDGHRQRSIVVGGVTAVAVVGVFLLLDGSLDVGAVAGRFFLVFASLAFGDTIRSRRALRESARERAQLEAHEREHDARRRVTDERLRIARELHDTVAHALVAINVRAGVADHLANAPDPAALRDIKAVSAAALTDLRATLALLREEGDGAPTEPTSDLEAIPRLVERARVSGLDADVNVETQDAVIPSAIGQAAFRIVQEALTNVLRHANASCAHVRVRTIADALDIEIVDDGRGDTATVGTGFGLIGMAERATALGGEVQTGPSRGGGWRVHAVLPLPANAVP